MQVSVSIGIATALTETLPSKILTMLLPVVDAQGSNHRAGGENNTRKVYQMAGEGLLRSFRSFRQSATKDVPKL